jgi:hypothetical protein
MKNRPVGAELCHAVGRTEIQASMTKLIIALHNFVNTPKN